VWAAIKTVARREGAALSAQHAVFAAAQMLAAVGAGLSMSRGGQLREPVMATGPQVEELEELQYTLGQGPCTDAVATGEPAVATDLANAQAAARWPFFAPVAARRGVRGMFSFPVAAGAAQTAVLSVYRLHAGPLRATQFAEAQAFADAVLTLVLDERSRRTPRVHQDRSPAQRTAPSAPPGPEIGCAVTISVRPGDESRG